MYAKMPQSRRDIIKNLVLSTLDRADIGKLPVNLHKILKTLNIYYVTSDFAKSFGVNNRFEDGYTIARQTTVGIRYLIVFNANGRTPQRIRWTIAHEIGHIVLGHISNDPLSYNPEAEANYFARELLTPLSVLDELHARTAVEIAAVCNISVEAAKLRVRDFERRTRYKSRYGNTYYDSRFLKQFGLLFQIIILAAQKRAKYKLCAFCFFFVDFCSFKTDLR